MPGLDDILRGGVPGFSFNVLAGTPGCSKTTLRKANSDVGEVEVQSFLHRLAQFLTSWEATTFLVGEYVEDEVRDNSLFTMVDGIIWLSQVTDRNSVVRKLQLMKLRGQG